MVLKLPENSKKDQKECPQCGFAKHSDDFVDGKVCRDCAEKNKLAKASRFIKETASLFGKNKSTEEEEGGSGAQKLELKHTRDVETLANEMELNKEARELHEALEKKEKEKRFVVKQKTHAVQEEKTLITSEETLSEKDTPNDESTQLESEPEKQEREKIPKPDDGPSDSPLKNSARFRQIQKDQLGFFENKRQMNAKDIQQKQKISELYTTQKKSVSQKLMSEETKTALSIAFRRWR